MTTDRDDIASLLETEIIDPQAWVHAVRTQHEGYPLWTYLDNDPRWAARARSLVAAYTTALLTSLKENHP
jgi:hypothetical protein